MSELEILIDRCNKMSILLGMAAATIQALMLDGSISIVTQVCLKNVWERLENGIDDLYYKKIYKVKKELIQQTNGTTLECEHQYDGKCIKCGEFY
jgi:hypothetical protein